MSILFLAHRLPFPPDRGDKIRAHHLLKALAKLAPVHVGCFAESERDLAHLPELAALAQSHCVPLRKTGNIIPGLRALATGRTVSEAAFDSGDLRRWVERTVAERGVDTIVVFSGQMGQFVPTDFAGRLVIDLCDVDSAKFEAYAETGSFPRRWINAREGRLLKRMEEALAVRADNTMLVSEEEAALFRSRLDDTAAANVSAIRNGIDFEFFDPAMAVAHPDLHQSAGPHFVFTGQMDYRPNITACIRAAKELMPAIREAHPTAQFHIVGRAPTAEILGLDSHGGTHVWGEVPDIRPFLAGADIMLAPLTIARGVQNKVLEAMAMACPVLLSPEAATGISARDEEHFAVAATNDQIIQKAQAMLADPASTQAMCAAARAFVVQHQSWAAMMAPLAALVGRPSFGGQRDAA
ncbi:MAG: TIGR03087 family PEP-CTERM/XrtA system glycosyltransferase [Alteripontixanthobacter sp.]